MADSPRLQQLFAFLDNKSDDAFVLFAIAKEYEKLNASDDALAYYLKLVKADENYVGVYYHLAKLYESRGLREEALETYTKGMQVARSQGDQHALSELSGAKMNLEIED